jgi:hypothetical protein
MRKLPASSLAARRDELTNYRRAVNQERQGKNKSYSPHEPNVLCISKGKEHKKYEFGAKAAIAKTKAGCIIVGAKSFSDNVYDGDTLNEVLSQKRHNWRYDRPAPCRCRLQLQEMAERTGPRAFFVFFCLCGQHHQKKCEMFA